MISITTITTPCHSGMLLAGEVVHGSTVYGPKDGVHVCNAYGTIELIRLLDRFRLTTCRNDDIKKIKPGNTP